MLDLTAIESPKFQYTLKPLTASQPPVVVTLDLDAIYFDLTASVPTLLKWTGENFSQKQIDEMMAENPNVKVKAGDAIIGLQKWMDWFKRKSTDMVWPTELPERKHIQRAIRIAFEVPPDYGWDVCCSILLGWVDEYGKYLDLKKNTLSSPVSPAATPA